MGISTKMERMKANPGVSLKIENHRQLDVCNIAFEAAVEIYETSKTFPADEKFSLTDQVGRSSRSVCANIAEAFRRRKYEEAFVSKLNDSEGEAAETQTWLEFAGCFGCVEHDRFTVLYSKYDNIIGKIVVMRNQPGKWSVG